MEKLEDSKTNDPCFSLSKKQWKNIIGRPNCPKNDNDVNDPKAQWQNDGYYCWNPTSKICVAAQYTDINTPSQGLCWLPDSAAQSEQPGTCQGRYCPPGTQPWEPNTKLPMGTCGLSP